MATLNDVATNQHMITIANGIRTVTRTTEGMTIPEMPERLVNIRVVEKIEKEIDLSTPAPLLLGIYDTEIGHLFIVSPLTKGDAALLQTTRPEIELQFNAETGELFLIYDNPEDIVVRVIIADLLIPYESESAGFLILQGSGDGMAEYNILRSYTEGELFLHNGNVGVTIVTHEAEPFNSEHNKIFANQILTGTGYDDLFNIAEELRNSIGEVETLANSKLTRVNSTTDKLQVYAKKTDGGQAMENIDEAATPNTIPRRNANGRFSAAKAVNNSEVVNLEQANELIAPKLDRNESVTEYQQVYAKTPQGENGMLNVSQQEVAGTVPIRDSGGRLLVGNGTADKNAVNLEQMNAGLNLKVDKEAGKGLLPDAPQYAVPHRDQAGTGEYNTYRQATYESPLAGCILIRDAQGRAIFSAAAQDNQGTTLGQVNSAIAGATAPIIEDIGEIENKLGTIADGAQVNILEEVKVNGEALAVVNKSVNVTVPTKINDLVDTTPLMPVARATGDAAGDTISSTYSKIADIVNALDSDATNRPLSAAMGKLLKFYVDGKFAELENAIENPMLIITKI